MMTGKHRIKLKDSNLKITPQRLAVLEALNHLKDHPTADNIKEFVIKNHPNVAVGTIYKTLESFVTAGLVRKVMTEKNVMRYDAIIDNHHHLYCEETQHIEDFFDDNLDKLIDKYFKEKKIPNFKVKDVKLQIIGKFNSKNKN